MQESEQHNLLEKNMMCFHFEFHVIIKQKTFQTFMPYMVEIKHWN